MSGPGAGVQGPTPTSAPTELRFQGAESTRIDPADWAQRAAEVRAELAADHVDDVDLDAVLATFQFADDAGRAWGYTGGRWLGWNGSAWVPETPAGQLRLLAFSLGLPVEDVPDAPDVRIAADQPRPTHVVPATGLPAWARPDAASGPPIAVAASTQLAVLEWQPSGWARVQASNGWTGWLDGRQLVALPV